MIVHASGVNSNGVSFTVVAAPSIASLSPTSGAVGASVTITGTGFSGASGVKFGNPDFVALATAFGAKGYRVDSARSLGPILAQALAHPGPSIVDVPVDYENAKLTAGLGQLICPI